MNLLIRWIASAVAVGVAAHLVPGITYDGRIATLFVVALIFGLVNAIVRPVAKMLSCGLIVLTLGLFLFVINAAMLLLTSRLAREFEYGFHVDGFVPALLGSIVISLVSWIITIILPDGKD